MPLDLSLIRQKFPALREQREQAIPAIFFDNPGGTQIAQSAIDCINSYLVYCNANLEGVFRTSVQSDAILAEARAAAADFFNAARAEEIVFGNNMTTLTLHISRSLARTWNAGDSIVVTRLDHDANITPWVLAAQDRDVTVSWVDFHPEDGTLDMDGLARALEAKPRLLAVGYASNALGTINPIETIVRMAHAQGTLVYVDAVHYAAHGPIDVQALECDFLVASAYKFFGPHVGVLYGNYAVLDDLFAYKVRPAPDRLPGKFETGTQNHEGIAGVVGAIEYLSWLGETFGGEHAEHYNQRFTGRRLHLKQAMAAVRSYEIELSRAVLAALAGIPGLRLYGLADTRRLEERVPTFSFTAKSWHPRWLAGKLAERGVYVWNGNYYAPAVTECLKLEGHGGMVRVGPVHYNTLDEVARLKEALLSLAGE